MQQWSRENDRPYNVFFREISKPRLIHWIKSGRISPWIIFNCDTGSTAISELTDQEQSMIMEYLEPTFWQRKFATRKADIEFVQMVLKEAGI